MNNIIDKIHQYLLSLVFGIRCSSILRLLNKPLGYDKYSPEDNSGVSLFAELFLLSKPKVVIPFKHGSSIAQYISKKQVLALLVLDLGLDVRLDWSEKFQRLISFIVNGRNVLKCLSLDMIYNDVKRLIICFYFVLQICQHNNLYSYGY